MINERVYLIDAYKPSLGDKVASDIATLLVERGQADATKAFNEFCIKHKFKDYDAVMLRDLVLYHLHRIQPDHPNIPAGYGSRGTVKPFRPTFI